jgi:nicotinate phosphoribosyltransferase
VFELFARRLPEGRRYGVVAGVGRALRALRHFRFDEEALRFLLDHEIVDDATAGWLSDFSFSGDIYGYAEGEIYFPGSPVVMVEASFAEGVLLETVLLSIYNHDSAIASAASRMTAMAADRPCIEMGSRRTQELAAVASARAAYIAGFDATSNLEAGRRYGVPTTGHRRARVHACCTTTSGRPSAPSSPRSGSTPPAGRHLRRLRGREARRRADRRPARRGPARLR